MKKGINRAIIVIFCVGIVVLVGLVATFLWIGAVDGNNSDNSSDIQSVNSSSEIVSSVEEEVSSETHTESQPEENNTNTVNLDATFGNLLLVNAQNPLPETYDEEIRDYLVEIDPQYRNNNNVTKIHKDVYPYITAMVAAAQKDGVDLKVWSPFRSYAIQKELFRRTVLIFF